MTEESTRTPSPAPRSDRDSSAAEGAPAVGWTRSRRVVTAVLTVLVLAAAVAAGYVVVQPGQADVEPDLSEDGDYTPGSVPSEPGAAAVRAAVEQLPEILSYDYRTLDDDLDQATQAMTPGFTESFTKTFDSVVRPMASENESVTRALVRGAGVTEVQDDGSRVSVLVFVDQLLLESATDAETDDQPNLAAERVRVTMTREDERWLVDEIEPF